MTDTQLRPAVMFKAMRTKVLTLLKTEATMSVLERKNQQWQLLFQIKGYGDYIVGKGGINTMFYTINANERKVCYPEDMLNLIDKWITDSSTVSFAIMRIDGKIVKSKIETQASALLFKAKLGYFIVRVADGKKTKLFVRSQSLFNLTWKPLIK